MAADLIPFFKPRLYSEHVFEAFRQDCNGQKVSNGPYVQALEQSLGQRYLCEAVATSSCTMGLWLVFRALFGLRATVVLPAFTWRSTADAVRMAGGHKLLFGDIHPQTWHLRADERLLTLADYVVVTDTFGSKAPQDYGEHVVYDGAMSIGCERLADRGLATVLSFSPSKLVSGGEGGAVLTTDAALAVRLRADRDWACRMSEFSALCVLDHLQDLPNVLREKDRIWSAYKTALGPHVGFQECLGESNHTVVGLVYPNDRSDFQAFLDHVHQFMETKEYYRPLEPALEQTEALAQRIVCVPSWVGLDPEHVIGPIKAWFER